MKKVKKPYFKNMEKLGLDDSEKESVLDKIFNQPISIENQSIYDIKDNEIYYENSRGYWVKSEYNTQGKEICYEDSRGYWEKCEYDKQKQDNIIYYEDSSGRIIDKR